MRFLTIQVRKSRMSLLFFGGRWHPANPSLIRVIGRALPINSSDNCSILINLSSVSALESKGNDIVYENWKNFSRNELTEWELSIWTLQEYLIFITVFFGQAAFFVFGMIGSGRLSVCSLQQQGNHDLIGIQTFLIRPGHIQVLHRMLMTGESRNKHNPRKRLPKDC